MRIGLDANLVVPYAHPTTEAEHRLRARITVWLLRHEVLAPEQALVEAYGVLTRPKEVGGKGLVPYEAMRVLKQTRPSITWVANPPLLFSIWQELVVDYSVSGKEVHDARIAAFILAGGADELATRNFSDFRRYGIPLREVA